MSTVFSSYVDSCTRTTKGGILLQDTFNDASTGGASRVAVHSSPTIRMGPPGSDRRYDTTGSRAAITGAMEAYCGPRTAAGLQQGLCLIQRGETLKDTYADCSSLKSSSCTDSWSDETFSVLIFMVLFATTVTMLLVSCFAALRRHLGQNQRRNVRESQRVLAVRRREGGREGREDEGRDTYTQHTRIQAPRTGSCV
jgi:hypothetical protein